jgi:hypothetical protein
MVDQSVSRHLFNKMNSSTLKQTSDWQVAPLKQNRWFCTFGHFLTMTQNPIYAEPRIEGEKQEHQNGNAAKHFQRIFIDQQAIECVPNNIDKLQIHPV